MARVFWRVPWASSLSQRLERAVCARAAALRGTDPLPCRRSFRKRLAAIAKINVLIIDDFAIAPIGLRERNDLLELLTIGLGAAHAS